MKQSEHFLENAENCAQLAEHAADEPTHNRYKRMEAAWRSLAAEQDWLDGEMHPSPKTNGDARKSPHM
jgi:ATP/maltotriose-dependent transcriptional regulator MalT